MAVLSLFVCRDHMGEEVLLCEMNTECIANACFDSDSKTPRSRTARAIPLPLPIRTNAKPPRKTPTAAQTLSLLRPAIPSLSTHEFTSPAPAAFSTPGPAACSIFSLLASGSPSLAPPARLLTSPNTGLFIGGLYAVLLMDGLIAPAPPPPPGIPMRRFISCCGFTKFVLPLWAPAGRLKLVCCSGGGGGGGGFESSWCLMGLLRV